MPSSSSFPYPGKNTVCIHPIQALLILYTPKRLPLSLLHSGKQINSSTTSFPYSFPWIVPTSPKITYNFSIQKLLYAAKERSLGMDVTWNNAISCWAINNLQNAKTSSGMQWKLITNNVILSMNYSYQICLKARKMTGNITIHLM